MAFTSDKSTLQATGSRVDLSWDDGAHDAAPKASRDWKRTVLLIGLGALSWVATFVGMLELIEANMGDLPFVHKAIIGFSVAMLMVMVVWLLDQIFSDTGWMARSLYVTGYLFLTLISVGFGFGFYWKVLESRSEASRTAEAAIGQVQTSLHAAATRLEQLQGTLDSLTTISTRKAETERASGTSCPNSRPGDGPRRKMRDDDAARFQFAAEFVKGRATQVRSEIDGLNGDLAKVVSDDASTRDKHSGTRNDFLRNLGRRLEATVTGFNAFRTDPQLKQIRIDLNDRADKVTFQDTRGGTYTCPDAQLSTALKGVVRAIDELPAMEKPRIAAVEGSEAVVEAFRRLTATLAGALTFKMPPSPDELRELQRRAVQSVENAAAHQAKVNALAEQAGLARRDYIPLAIAMFVDLCLLLVSIRRSGDRMSNLVGKMRAAERGPVIQILSRFNEIHRDGQIRENFEVFRHVVFDFHGDYYAAVPLNAPYRPNPHNDRQRRGYGVSDAEALVQEAHLLSNLFASFEKERVFTRVYSPLLTTRMIQKRLRRQGSKFANAEAFRVYKFRNGAWSDLILGAVMGAARRVEGEKRRRRIEESIFSTREPELTRDGGEALVGFGGRQEPSAPAAAQSAMPAPAPAADADAGVAVGAMRNSAPSRAAAMEAPPPFIPPRTPSTPARRDARGLTARGTAAAIYSMARQPEAWPEPASPVTPLVREEPPQARVATHHSTADAETRHADTASLPRTVAENVIPYPVASKHHPDTSAERDDTSATAVMAAAAPEPRVTVSAVRETVTYSVPVSEASLPPALDRLLNQPREDAGAIAENPATLDQAVASDPPAATRRLPPPLPTISQEDTRAGDEDLRAMAMRLRPERREE
ncbi:MAG: hypothetical protein R3D68_13330 [Hyphomicrobiaceae bacterium]